MLQLICSYVFYPCAYVMGVAAEDCRQVGSLLGMKTFLNEFVAYVQLSKVIRNKDLLNDHLDLNGDVEYSGMNVILKALNETMEDTTLIYGVISVRCDHIPIFPNIHYKTIRYVSEKNIRIVSSIS